MKRWQIKGEFTWTAKTGVNNIVIGYTPELALKRQRQHSAINSVATFTGTVTEILLHCGPWEMTPNGAWVRLPRFVTSIPWCAIVGLSTERWLEKHSSPWRTISIDDDGPEFYASAEEGKEGADESLRMAGYVLDDTPRPSPASAPEDAVDGVSMETTR